MIFVFLTVLSFASASAELLTCEKSKLVSYVEEMREEIACSEQPVGTRRVVDMKSTGSPYMIDRPALDKDMIWINPRFLHLGKCKPECRKVGKIVARIARSVFFLFRSAVHTKLPDSY